MSLNFWPAVYVNSSSAPFSHSHHFPASGLTRSVLSGRKTMSRLWNVPAWTFRFLESLEGDGHASVYFIRAPSYRVANVHAHTLTVWDAGAVGGREGGGGGLWLAATQRERVAGQKQNELSGRRVSLRGRIRLAVKKNSSESVKKQPKLSKKTQRGQSESFQ